MLKEGYFHCFDRFQQRVFRNGGRITNRSFTDWEPTRKLQVEQKRKPMTEVEASAVIKLTGHKCFLEEKFV